MGSACEDVRCAYLAGELTDDDERHMAECADCRFLRDVRDAVRNDDAGADAAVAVDPAHASTAADDANAPIAPEPRPGTLPEVAVGRYGLGREIGKGGIGRVRRAQDRVLGRTVAIKELLADDAALRRRFVREAMITARLQHPAIVPVYDAGSWANPGARGGRDRSPFYAMKLIAGRPLSDAIRGAATPAARLALIPAVLAATDAIAYAHAQRVIHRDLKPGNVMVGEFGETIVIDWGLAKDAGDDDRELPNAGPYRELPAEHTAAGVRLGTPAYMPPEQAAGEPVDARADVYALGATLYHVIAGVPPHDGADRSAMIARVIAGDVVPLAVRAPDVPPDLAAIVTKAMAHDRADRYPTARELAEDLRRFVSGQLVGTHRYSLGELLRRWVRRHRVPLAIALAALAVLGAYGGWSVHRILAETARADRARDAEAASAREAAGQRDDARAQANRAVLAQARTALAADPSEALRLVTTLSPDAPGWASARVIAADARSRPRVIAGAVLRQDARPPIETSKWTVDPAHDRAFAWSWGWLWIVELSTGAVAVVDAKRPIWPDEMTACDDGRRLVGESAGSDHVDVVELDVRSRGYQTHALTAAAALEAGAACSASLAVDVTGGRLVRWDATAHAPQLLAAAVVDARLAPDRAHAVSIDERGAVTVWDLATGAGTLIGAAPSAARIIAASGDGRTVVVARGADALAVRAGQPPVVLPAQLAGWTVAPDGAWLAATSARDLARSGDVVVERSAPRRVVVLSGARFEHSRELVGERADWLGVSADGRWLVARTELADGLGATRIHVWNMESGAHALVTDRAVEVRIVDGGRIATRDASGKLEVWTLPAPAFIAANTFGAAASRDGRWLAERVADGVRRLDTTGATAPEIVALPIPESVDSALFLRRAIVSAAGDVVVPLPDGSVTRWPRGGAAWEPLGRAPDAGALGAPVIDFTSSGAPMAWADREIVVWDRGGERRLSPLASPQVRRLVAVDRDVVHAAAVDTTTGAVLLVDTADHRERPLPGSRGNSNENGVAFSRDGRVLVTGTAAGDGYLVWDVATATAHPIARGDARPGSIVVSNDGRRVALGTPDSIVVVDVATGARHVLPSAAPPSRFAFDDTGDRLIASSTAGVTLWSIDAAEPRTLTIDEGWQVAASGSTVVVVTSRGVLRFTDDLPSAPCALLAALGARCAADARLPKNLDGGGQI